MSISDRLLRVAWGGGELEIIMNKGMHSNNIMLQKTLSNYKFVLGIKLAIKEKCMKGDIII